MNDISIDIINAVKEIKSAIVRAQARVSANANAEMLSLYFGIGRYVSYKTQTEKWGTGIIDTISAQLQKEMPGLRGFSGKSIRKMRQFYEAWSDSAIWPSATAKLESGGNALSIEAVKSEHHESVGTIWPSATTKLEAANGVAVTVAEFLSISFSYHMEILSGVKTLEERLFYIHEAAQNKWKERQLRESIKRDDFNHRGAMPSNFAATIPDATLARKTRTCLRLPTTPWAGFCARRPCWPPLRPGAVRSSGRRRRAPQARRRFAACSSRSWTRATGGGRA